ncbi:hypothetical protein D3C84_1061560 [compost metagenome]
MVFMAFSGDRCLCVYTPITKGYAMVRQNEDLAELYQGMALAHARSYGQAGERNQVAFNSEAEAEAAGFRQAGNCQSNPPGSLRDYVRTELLASRSWRATWGHQPALQASRTCQWCCRSLAE